MSKSIWRKKPLAAYEADFQKNELKRVLGRWGLTSLGIGAIIGGGIFVLTGIAAQNWAGPALAISFLLAGIGCTFAALCYAEFASILPVEGSAYAYSYGTVGEFFAWFVGWNLVLEYMMGATTVAVSWSGYFEKLLHLFGIYPPLYLMNDPITAAEKAAKMAAAGETVPDFAFAFNLPALLIVWVVTYILIKGIKEAAKTNNIIVIVKVAVVLFVIFAGAFFIDVQNWSPFIPEPIPGDGSVNPAFNDGKTHYGFPGVVTAAGIVFFAYIGFDAVSTQAGEAINPRKDVPFAIIASLLICTLLYILVSLVLTGMVPYQSLDMKAPVAQAFADAGLGWAVYIITIAAVAGLTSVMLVMMLSQTRIFLGMAKDGLLPRNIFAAIHPVFKTPYKSTFLVGLVVSVVAALTPIDKVSEMTSMGTLLAFAMICGAVWLLLIKYPDIERPYKAPFLTLVAPLGIFFNIWLMTSLRHHTWIAFLIWGAVGIIVYFAYSRHHSNLHPKNLK
jgi:APA family basic amino acid/polyamine antiporter